MFGDECECFILVDGVFLAHKMKNDTIHISRVFEDEVESSTENSRRDIGTSTDGARDIVLSRGIRDDSDILNRRHIVWIGMDRN